MCIRDRVYVHPQRALVHFTVGHPGVKNRSPQLPEIGLDFLYAAEIRLGNNLDQKMCIRDRVSDDELIKSILMAYWDLPDDKKAAIRDLVDGILKRYSKKENAGQ